MNSKRYKWKIMLPIVLVFCFLLPPSSVVADVQYWTFTKNNFNQVIWTQPAYYPLDIIGNDLYIPDPDDPDQPKYSPLYNPQDVFIDNKDHIYVADAGNNRIVHFDDKGELVRFITLPDNPFDKPHGVFVTNDGSIYVADTGNKRVVKLDKNGDLLREFPKPDSRYIPDGYQYDPTKLIVDQRGYIYITTLGGYQGLMQLDPEGDFTGFYGTNITSMSFVDKFKKAVYTREMWANELSKIPGVIRNAAVDDDGFIYTVTSGIDIKDEQVKKLNVEGKNILAQYKKFGKKKQSYGIVPWYATVRDSKNNTRLPSLIDVAVDGQGNFTVIDTNFRTISQYDAEGKLLFFWVIETAGGTTQLGVIKNPIALDINSKNELFVLDNQEAVIHRYRLTEFGAKVHEANSLTMDGYYSESEELWEEVLQLNAFFGPAVEGLAMAAYKNQNFSKSADLFLQSGNQKGYSDSFWQQRLLWFQQNFSWFASSFIILFFVFMSFNKLTRKTKWREKWRNRERTKNTLLIQLKHAFYILKHPLDGFNDIRHENKGSYLSAIIILIGSFLALVFIESYTSFTFNKTAPFHVNLFDIFTSFYVIWICWVICNYLISSIYNGEGRFKDVFIGSAYSLMPLIIVGIPLAIISNVMTESEKAIYDYLFYGMMAWVGLLFFWKVQSLQNYSVGETAYNIVLSVFSMVVLAVLGFICFGLSNELRIFIYEIYQEVSIR